MLFFDLDGTIHDVGKYRVYGELERNIFTYIADRLGVTYDRARHLSENFQKAYGSTVAGLRVEHDMDPTCFLDAVYRVDFSSVLPDRRLFTLLSKNRKKKIVFTNATRAYTEELLDRIGILRCFDGIFDIYDCNFASKPQPDAFLSLFKKFEIDDPSETTLVDDRTYNLRSASAFGMRTILCSSVTPDSWPVQFDDIYSIVEHLNRDGIRR